MWLLRDAVATVVLLYARAVVTAPSSTTATTTTTASLTCQTISPSGYNCGTVGYLKAAAPSLSNLTVPTLDDCRDACLEDKNCTSFGYQSITEDCTRYNETLSRQGITDQTNGSSVFYTRHCFACSKWSNSTSSSTTTTTASSTTTAAPSYQTIASQDFEDGKFGNWSRFGNTGLISPGYDSSHHAAYIKVTPESDRGEICSPVISSMVVGQEYTLSFEYRISSPSCGLRVTTNNDYDYFLNLGPGDGPFPSVKKWTHFDVNLFQEDGDDSGFDSYCIFFYCAREDHESVELDNILVVSLGPQELFVNISTPTGANVINEPNFDSGTFDAWSTVDSYGAQYSLASPGYNGAPFCVGVTVSQDDYFILKQSLDTTVNQAYQFSFAFMCNVDVSSTGYFSLDISLIDQTDYEYIFEESCTTEVQSTPAGQWGVVTTWVSALSAEAVFTLSLGNIPSDMTWQFGNFTLVPV